MSGAGPIIDDPRPAAPDRLAELDGMRAVAALVVLLYHYMVRFAEPHHPETIYPHGALLAGLPAFPAFGKFGILLFFLVSGFVIMRTLERCSGLADFIGRRIARLWPAMLVCATVTTLVVNGTGFHERFTSLSYWQVTPFEYVLSIFFIDPAVVAKGLGYPPARWVDGAYWTLWAEVRFYALIAFVFWIVPRRLFFWAWAATQVASTATTIMLLSTPSDQLDISLGTQLLLQPELLCWFTLGICGYAYYSGRAGPAIILAGMFALCDLFAQAVLAQNTTTLTVPLDRFVLFACVLLPFTLFVCRSRLTTPLSARFLTAIGIASYPLYLIHQIVGIILIQALSDAGTPPILALLLVTVIVILIALMITRYIEEPVRRVANIWWRPTAAMLQSKVPVLKF